MKQFAFMLFLISGSYTLWPCFSLQYHLVTDKKSWSDAQSFCRQNYADLVSLLHQGQEALLPQSSEDAWIGLRGAWQWSVGHPDLYQEAEDSPLTWREGEPDRLDDHDNCVATYGNGKFEDFACSSIQFRIICYKEGQTLEYFPISNPELSWTEAQKYCKDQNYTGLAVMKNAEEYLSMLESLQSLSMKYWWIGLSKIWMWSNRSQFSYENLEENHREKRYPVCATVLSSGKWRRYNCSDEKPFYCYDDDLILVRENRTWDEALDYCRRHHSDLVSVGSESLQHRVKRRAQQASTDHVWLGFSSISKRWYWISEDKVCQQNWTSQDLQEECGHMGAIGSRGGQKWYKLPKTERLNFICRK